MRKSKTSLFLLLTMAIAGAAAQKVATAQGGPMMSHPNLNVRTVITGLELPTSMAFLGPNDFLVLEKNTGKVKHVVNGAVQSTVLDLRVNFASERGLLGITLHPEFPKNPGVYLYWTCTSQLPPADAFRPNERRCMDSNMFGPDSDNILQVPLLGNRVDRFEWNGSSLTYKRNIIMLRAFQNDGAPEPPDQGDSGQPPRGNHDGGIIQFGPDGKLYILIGDVGRRGQLQNLPSGPTLTGLGPRVPDDQFGGPEPDNAHLTGVILRLNDDGSIPRDNPFFRATANGEDRDAKPDREDQVEAGGDRDIENDDQIVRNIRRIYAYGIRNSFGLTFDPMSGMPWMSEHGDDAFDEINRVPPGMNGGWIQVMGPLDRLAQYKEIEVGRPGGLQQLRWPPTRIADTAGEAQRRLFRLPGSRLVRPAFSWKFAALPVGLGFVRMNALGEEFRGNLFVGVLGDPATSVGYLFRFKLSANRNSIVSDDPRVNDKVADNNAKYDLSESESFIIGSGFGNVTDIENAPSGNIFVVSLSNGSVYEIFRR